MSDTINRTSLNRGLERNVPVEQDARSIRILVMARDAPERVRAAASLVAEGVEIEAVSDVVELQRELSAGMVDALVIDTDPEAVRAGIEAQSLCPGLPLIAIASADGNGWTDTLRTMVSAISGQRRDPAMFIETAGQRLARRLAKAERIEALGQMASGIAHDFNNTLMAALPWADLLRRKYPDDGVIQRAAEQIRGAVRRAADVTRQLLDFAQPRRPEVKKLDLREFVERQSALLKKTLPANIEFGVDLASPVEVKGDPAQLGQVLLALILNARDSMPDGGRVTIRTDVLDEERAPDLDLPAGTWAVVTVSDTGPGIDAAYIDKVFDPYFTTKDLGMGAGLGLSVAQRIMERHGGFFRISSPAGGGTQVRLALPAIVPEEEADSNLGAAGTSERLAGLRVLIIDDDTAVVAGLEALLAMEGAILETRDRGRSALALLDSGYLPDLVILDLGLPEIPGEEIYQAIRQRHTSLPILVATGWGDTERTKFLNGDHKAAFQSKPFVIEALVSAIGDLRS